VDALAHKLKPWRIAPGVLGLVVALTACIVLANFDASLTPRMRALTLGLFLSSGWLFTPFIVYTLVLENRDKYFFLLTVYPRFLRLYMAYGWVLSLVALSAIWTVLLVSS
jgi:hypothetical protein